MSYKTVKNPKIPSTVYSITQSKPVLLPNGDQKTEPVLDDDEKPILDDDGNPILKPVFEDVTYACTIQEPEFATVAIAMCALLSGYKGATDMMGSGKVIFEACAIDYDPEYDNNVKLLAKLCIKLAEEYVLPVSEEVKKN